MKTDNPVLQAKLAGILAAGTSMAAGNAWAVPDQPKNWEKCAGIVWLAKTAVFQPNWP